MDDEHCKLVLFSFLNFYDAGQTPKTRKKLKNQKDYDF